MKLSEILGEGKFKDLDLELQELGVRSSAARSSAFRVAKDCKTFEDFNKRVSHIGGLANLGANVLEKVWSTVRATQVREAKDESRFTDEQINELENQLDKLLPESVEITFVGDRTHGKKGYLAAYTLDNGKKGEIEFDCRLHPTKIEDLRIFAVRGGLKGINQDIFTTESLEEGLPKWEKHPTRKGVLYRAISPADRARAKADEELKALRKKIKKNEEHRRKIRTGEKKLKLTDAQLEEVAQKIETSVGNAIPDGDPIDSIGPWFRRKFGLPNDFYDIIEYLDKAVKKHVGKYKGYYDYLADSWEDYEDPRSEERFPFKGKNNPWR